MSYDTSTVEGSISHRVEVRHGPTPTYSGDPETVIEVAGRSGQYRNVIVLSEQAAKQLRNQLNAHLSQIEKERRNGSID